MSSILYQCQNMTSEIETLKTNEFLRRRKLRLQQVREQSKDIAKKIRQRAKVEKIRHIVDRDAKKEKDYFDCQNKLVKRLEHLYAQGLQNVGAGHKEAANVREEELPEKEDLSKLRAKTAAAELRRKRQEKLDEQKKLLDRRLQARETANEISREKSSSSALVNKAKSSTSVKPTEDSDSNVIASSIITAKENDKGTVGDDHNKDKPKVVSDMGTQWDSDVLPNEWEPNVPALSLPKDDSLKESTNIESKSEKSRRLNLFAVSDEMPSSLRGGLTDLQHGESTRVRPSLTLVSEYLQNRALRLRETDRVDSSQKLPDDIQSIKQTILRTRSSKHEGKGNTGGKSAKSNAADIVLNKKSSVIMYNHSTKDMRDVPSQSEGFVTRDLQENEDAYSQAEQQASIDNIGVKDKEHQQLIKDMRHKIAMTKQNVEKEYKDTMAFLNSLPKNTTNKPIKTAYMDERRQQMVKERRQQKLEQEYKKVEKENRKHTCIHGRSKSKTPEPRQQKSKSPMNGDLNDNYETVDMQYSWMPVPDSDGSLAIHTIPTAVKTGKAANSVKFSKVDSYHEYRSRHKHTPPTKDTSEKQKRVETVLIQEQNQSSDNSSINSDASSIDNSTFENVERRKISRKDLSDADKIIIYKILNSNKEKKVDTKEKHKKSDSVKSLSSSEKNKSHKTSKQGVGDNNEEINEPGTSFQHLKEGVYKTTNENGDNITSMYYPSGSKIDKTLVLTEDEINHGKPCRCNKKVDKDHQQNKGTYVERESDNTSQTRSGNTCDGCKCGCVATTQYKESHAPPVQPSASTSTSSFKTAANNRASNVLSDGGNVKFINEVGDETGKFYIGASGFLKEDAYEFVIQLKKKESNKTDERRERGKIEDKTLAHKEVCTNSDIGLQHTDSVITKVTSGETDNSKLQERLAYRSPLDTGSKTISVQKKSSTNQPSVYDVNNVTTDLENNGKFVDSKSTNDLSSVKPSQTKDVSDKGVCTSFHDTYAIPSRVTKSDFTQRITTSTYTQTSLNSPNNRPIFMHMSSSTSTAYMSPPEMVLPKFLKQDHSMTYCNNKWFEVAEQLEYDEYASTCKRCSHRRKVMLNAMQERKKLETPPNTARSCSSRYKYDNDKISKCSKSSVNSSQILRQKSKCPKCESHARSIISVKPLSHRSKRNLASNKRSTHILQTNIHMSPNQKKNNVNSHTHKKFGKSNLNPVLKKYVNKLLALNRESLKAIDVANQECSSITTPGSSIIEVPSNIHENKMSIENKISLEQIKEILKQKILEDCDKVEHKHKTHSEPMSTESHIEKSKTFIPRIPRKKPVHKVKSLNISKRILKTRYVRNSQQPTENLNSRRRISTSTSTKEDSSDKKPMIYTQLRTKIHTKASPSHIKEREKFAVYNLADHELDKSSSFKKVDSVRTEHKGNIKGKLRPKGEVPHYSTSVSLPSHRATITSTSNYSDHKTGTVPITEQKQLEESICISTQTNRTTDSDINFMKLAENKLQNMEKIADLTEKCTIRLSNLAKVLEEVRKNKSLAYSQISTSDSASESDHKSDKNDVNESDLTGIKINTAKPSDPSSEIKKDSNEKATIKIQSCYPNVGIQSTFETISSDPTTKTNETENVNSSASDYIPLLKGIPKPGIFKPSAPVTGINITEKSSPYIDPNVKSKGKPPPALSRINLKIGEENVVPHELSTVLEVDSPMSVKLKNQSSQQDNKSIISENEELKRVESTENVNQDKHTNPDLLQSNKSLFKQQSTFSSNDSPDDSKRQMMDLQQFNDIMLKPFPTIQEYAKQCNMESLDEGSNLEDIPQSIINDELSSLHSDGSLPDVVAELLKRNIISEPFKFDSTSNGNSTTSESMLSALALSRVTKQKKKGSVQFHHKDNIAESSDTLSASSNPDLENAFKKLGMGWASSTLKKTKERLALSSSSNTSSSSISQTFKMKGIQRQNVPALVTDSFSSIHEISKKKEPSQGRKSMDSSKHAEQQTSMTNSMTVKEFLTNELAKRITFTNKSDTKDSEDEFVSLYSTKMPDELKHLVQNLQEERSMDSAPSGNNRARTSTPVQLFRSITYQSSSNSNTSNGLFSNADELSSVKMTSNSIQNASSSDKDDLTIPNYSLKMRKPASGSSKSD